jgi:hypothetical protein
VSDDIRVSLRTFFSPKSGYASTSSTSSSCARSLSLRARLSIGPWGRPQWRSERTPSLPADGCERDGRRLRPEGTLWHYLVL